MRSAHAMPFGASVLEGGGTCFALWAPGAEAVMLELESNTDRDTHTGDGSTAAALHMQPSADGWHRLDLPSAVAGARYRYRLVGGAHDGLRVPDPASRSNADDVQGPSSVVDPRAYLWRDAGWRGRPWHEAVIYELHVGTFTPEGTFAATQARLAALAELGITAIELMPLAEFPGERNWGYDGVLPFAPESAYGTPDDLKSLIDAAHALGLMVLIDVVYNHFGPEGNYLHAYAPQFFNPAHTTPWGAAINFDAAMSRTVRDFFVHNALYWVEEFHADGLRLDAVHAIRDDSQPDIVSEIAQALREGPGRDRAVHLVLENDTNQATRLVRSDDLVPQQASGQWNDDLHHAAHVLITGETDGYYADYATEPLRQFGRALAQGFVFQGDASAFRGGEKRGEPSGALPLPAFISFLQTHDQVGNRAFGDRIHSLADAELLSTAWACLLLSPHVPMFFMGDEFSASTPFQYFCDFGPELAAAVLKGRRAEFGGFKGFGSDAALAAIPDPNAVTTFDASKLKWDERSASPHREMLAYIRTLLDVRNRELVPRLAGQRGGGSALVESASVESASIEGAPHGAAAASAEVLRVIWPVDGGRWHLLANFAAGNAFGLTPPPGATIHARGVHPAGDGTVRMARGAVLVTFESTLESTRVSTSAATLSR